MIGWLLSNLTAVYVYGTVAIIVPSARPINSRPSVRTCTSLFRRAAGQRGASWASHLASWVAVATATWEAFRANQTDRGRADGRTMPAGGADGIQQALSLDAKLAEEPLYADADADSRPKVQSTMGRSLRQSAPHSVCGATIAVLVTIGLLAAAGIYAALSPDEPPPPPPPAATAQHDKSAHAAPGVAGEGIPGGGVALRCDPASWSDDEVANGFTADCSQCSDATDAHTRATRARAGGCTPADGPVVADPRYWKQQKCLITSRVDGFVGGEVNCGADGQYVAVPAVRQSEVVTCQPYLHTTAAQAERIISKIAFGSCANQHDPQPILGAAVAHSPDLFVYLGDNIYGDTVSMQDLQMKYAQLKARQVEEGLCDWVSAGGQLLQTWDDHDRGENDCGRYYEKAAQSRDIFFDFWRGALWPRLDSVVPCHPAAAAAAAAARSRERNGSSVICL